MSIEQIKARAEAATPGEWYLMSDIEFIAHARQDIPALCDALEVAREAMEHEGGMILRDAIARIDKILEKK